jgi:hypothetical protein
MSGYAPLVSSGLRNPITFSDSESHQFHASHESDGSEDHRSPYGPITSRMSSDETDTESVATDFTEDTVTDNGEEFTASRQVRYLEAKQNWNNLIDRMDETLQYANDGVINGVQSVYGGFTAAIRYLYDNIVWPAYQEMMVQLHAARVTIVLAIGDIFTGIFHLVRLFFTTIYRFGRWLWRVAVDSVAYLKTMAVDFFTELFEVLGLLAEFLWRWGVEIVLRTGQALMRFAGRAYANLGIFTHWLLQVAADSAVALGTVSRAGARVVWKYLCIFARMLYQGVRAFLGWLIHDGLRYAFFVGLISMVSYSLMKGWLGMSLYACDNVVYNNNNLYNNPADNNTEIQVTKSFLQSTCELGGVNNAVQITNTELAALLDASDTVIRTTDDMKSPIFIELSRSTGDLTNTLSRLQHFAELHQFTFATFSPEDTGALATIPPPETPSIFTEVKNHAGQIRDNAEIVRHELEIRYDELNVRLNSIQKYSKKNGSQSNTGLLLSEASYFLLPSFFKLTHTHRQSSDYARVARQILEDRITVSTLEKTSDIMSRIETIAVLMVAVRKQLRDFQDDWTVACASWKARHGDATMQEAIDSHKHLVNINMFQILDDAERCGKDQEPENWIKNLDAAILKMTTAAKTLVRVNAEHYTILQGLVAVHTQVRDLLDSAGGYKGEPKTQLLLPDLLELRSCDGHARCDGQGRRDPITITPMTARAILRAFVAHVGEMNIVLGRQRSDYEMPVQKVEWIIKDGQVLGREEEQQPHWTILWAKQIGVFVDTWM